MQYQASNDLYIAYCSDSPVTACRGPYREYRIDGTRVRNGRAQCVRDCGLGIIWEVTLG
ncbi:hypothetical protein [Paraglaciecola sp. 2405UD69-4]|uniref:hypothetical protein n=1 Tax=Paraglaciecola sp. 2405UD69-4 TaxID=3391836 RepID=UPI0039C9D40A